MTTEEYVARLVAIGNHRSERLETLPREELIRATDAIFAEYHASLFDLIEEQRPGLGYTLYPMKEVHDGPAGLTNSQPVLPSPI